MTHTKMCVYMWELKHAHVTSLSLLLIADINDNVGYNVHPVHGDLLRHTRRGRSCASPLL